MASKSTIRSFSSLTRPARRCCVCNSPSSSIKAFHTSTSKSQDQYANEQEERPRWSYTPEKMKAPFSMRAKDPSKEWVCNKDPWKLDQVYNIFLGRGGQDILSDELKWLAVTHKSFDQGRRGFNDRLAFFGRRIIELQTSLTLLNSPIDQSIREIPDEYNREPFRHPALEGLRNIDQTPISTVLTIEKFANFANKVGISEVTQWKPRYPRNLPASGFDVVMTSSIYGIIGAISLHRGGDLANTIARERVLKPMGIS